MKGFVGVLLAATPLALIILYFTMSTQKEIQLEQKTFEAAQELQEAEFDKQFKEMLADIDGKELSEEEKKEMEKRIAELKKKREKWEAQFDKQFEQSDKDLEALKAAMDEGAKE